MLYNIPSQQIDKQQVIRTMIIKINEKEKRIELIEGHVDDIFEFFKEVTNEEKKVKDYHIIYKVNERQKAHNNH